MKASIDMEEPTTDGYGPEFKALVASLRTLDSQKRREQGAEIVQKAQRLMHEGKLTPADVMKLHALNLRLESGR